MAKMPLPFRRARERHAGARCMQRRALELAQLLSSGVTHRHAVRMPDRAAVLSSSAVASLDRLI